ncbi:hypothetical protein CR513_41848, partial [Mucuna pruriens]
MSFELPTEIKTRNKNVIPDSGYVPSSKGVYPLYEALGIYDIKSHPIAHCTQSLTSTQVKSSNLSYKKKLY